MTLQEALWQDPERVSGAVCFRGTRVPVKTLFDHLTNGELAEFYTGFPNVIPAMVAAVLDSSLHLIEIEVSMKKSA